MAALPNVKASMESALDSAQVDGPNPAQIPGRILALDYGRKRLGVAVSDEMRLTARPLETMTRTNRSQLFRKLREIARTQQARLILVGYPLSLDGSVNEMAAEAAAFASRLEKEVGIPVELADERLTSWAAAQLTRAATRHPRKKSPASIETRTKDDALAAAILLEDYLDTAAANAPTPPRIPAQSGRK